MKRIAPTVLASVGSLAAAAATLGLLELGCRLYLSSFELDSIIRQMPGEHSVDRALRLIGGQAAPVVQDLDLLWRNEPGATRTAPIYPRVPGRDDHWTVAINSEGFRGPERAAGRADRKPYRVLCIGDSVTFGYHVEQGDEYPRRLETILRRHHPGRAIEVVNAAVPGWSWVQGVHFLETRGLDLLPDLVVIAHGTNDRFWPARVTDSEHIWLLQNPTLRTLQATTRLVRWTATYRTLASTMPPAPLRSPSPGCVAQMRTSFGCVRVALEEIEGSVQRARRLTQEAGVDLVVMNLDFIETGAVEAVRRAVQRDRIPFIDQVAKFRDLYLIEMLRRGSDLGVAPPRVPTMRLRPALPLQAPRRQRLLLRVLVERPGADVRVRGGYTVGKEPVHRHMYDDGTHGDERPGDAVFSTIVRLPDNARRFSYRYYMDGQSEFEPPPSYPESWGNRLLKLADDSIGPVDLFGEMFLMAENAHPNALGQQVIATNLADEIESLASFGDFVQDSAP